MDQEEVAHIAFLNNKKKFKKEIKTFKGVDATQKAVAWGRENLENFNLDMIY